MLAIERRRSILSSIQSEQSVVVSELAKRFNVTEETIRRDLDKLAQDGFVTKTYGGAVYNESSSKDLPFRVRESSNKKEKIQIARYIMGQIKSGSTLMMDSSSTVLELARLLKNKERITIITNSVEMLIELSDYPNIDIISTGGALRPSSLSLLGKNAIKTIENYHVDIAVISCKGIDLKNGLTDSNEHEAEVKKAMIRSAKRVIVAADSSKLNKTAFVKLMDISSCEEIVTVENGEKIWRDYAEESGKVIFV